MRKRHNYRISYVIFELEQSYQLHERSLRSIFPHPSRYISTSVEANRNQSAEYLRVDKHQSLSWFIFSKSPFSIFTWEKRHILKLPPGNIFGYQTYISTSCPFFGKVDSFTCLDDNVNTVLALLISSKLSPAEIMRNLVFK